MSKRKLAFNCHKVYFGGYFWHCGTTYPAGSSIASQIWGSCLSLIGQLLQRVHSIREHPNQKLKRNYNVQLWQHLHPKNTQTVSESNFCFIRGKNIKTAVAEFPNVKTKQSHLHLNWFRWVKNISIPGHKSLKLNSWLDICGVNEEICIWFG